MMEIILLMGQSNMAGKGNALMANRFSGRILHPNVWSLRAGFYWQHPATEPLHVGPGAGTGVGPGLFFADKVIGDGKELVLVPCAYGGTTMQTWTPGGAWYERTLKYAGRAIRRWEALVTTALFYQGEANAVSKELAAAWAGGFEHMVAGLQDEFPGINVIFAQLCIIKAPVVPHPYWVAVKEAQASIDLPGVTMIRTDDITPADLPIPTSPVVQPLDGVHLTTGAYKVVGERFADAYLGGPGRR